MKKKVLLMGKSGSGKTSMRSIIFANYIARDTRRLGATIDVEHSHVRFLGNLVLNLWDCGGQPLWRTISPLNERSALLAFNAFFISFLFSQNIFRNVEVLIYVFDVESRELEKDMHYYQSCLEAILQFSPETKIYDFVLLMGKSGSGKTSMRSIIFANYIARDTRRLGATIDVEHSHVRFLGNLVLNLWDCGGQEAFMENYFAAQRENIFRNVEVLIYVFDVESRELEKDMHYYQSCLEAILQFSPETKIFCLIHKMDLIFRNVEVLIYVFDVESRELEKDMHYYQSCLEAILQFSPETKIFCLIHKMDLVQEDQRELVRRSLLVEPLLTLVSQQIFKERETDLKRLSRPLDCVCFRTSIWDETLYKAWSTIVYSLIPNVHELEKHLNHFAEIIDADEVLLFERATFLVISYCQRKPHRDVHRFEKVSNIIKQFKLSCSKLAAQFHSMEVKNANFAAFIDVFTPNTYVMVIMSDATIPSAATLINIRNSRKHFEKLEGVRNAQSFPRN
ncbi:unnamed protein product [Medioppia subpectinata]|uniref:Ras-related GTP-binding protein A n=1 Tax=Medioppia subpectinata TaxID=1979941 RepID=A0A7R9KRU6_9ACAR|nr:unnamed protein product [Medioppia subpectinata]CAG2108585.1 unnamed protein product [Medioppia subpectinata]